MRGGPGAKRRTRKSGTGCRRLVQDLLRLRSSEFRVRSNKSIEKRLEGQSTHNADAYLDAELNATLEYCICI